MSSSKKNPLIGAFKNSDPVPNEKPVEDKKLTETVKPVEGEKKLPETVKPAGGEKKLPEAVKVAESGKKSPEVVESVEGEKKSPEAVKPTESDKKPPEAVKAVESEKKPTEAVKAVESEKKPSEAEKASDGEEIPADFHLDIVSASDLGKVIHFPLDMIDDFEDHPYPVTDDKDMDELVDSIKKFGVLEPITIIPNAKKAGRMEMVAGHRRRHAAMRAGLKQIPAIVRKMDHDEATIYMVDSNLKRTDIPISVKAKAYRMKLEAMTRKAGRKSKAEKAAMEAAGIKSVRSDEQLAQQVGVSRATLQRIVSVDKLEEPLKKMVDDKELPLDSAAQIAQLTPKEQKVLADAIEKEGGKVPSKTEINKLKEESKAGTLTEEKIEKAVAPTKREVEPPLKVTLTDEELRPYFPDKKTTLPDVKRGIFEALDLRKKAIERQKAKAAEEKGAKKPSNPVR